MTARAKTSPRTVNHSCELLMIVRFLLERPLLFETLLKLDQHLNINIKLIKKEESASRMSRTELTHQEDL